MSGELDYVTFLGLFHSKPFYDSVILQNDSQDSNVPMHLSTDCCTQQSLGTPCHPLVSQFQQVFPHRSLLWL